jgi:integrase/recombinase XerC
MSPDPTPDRPELSGSYPVNPERRPGLPARLDPGHGADAHPHLPAVGAIDLVAAFLSGRKPTTLDAYRRDLADFARFVGAAGPGPAVELLVSGSAGQANALALGYKADLIARGLASATIARRLAALRSMVKLARTLGRCSWTIEVEAPKIEAYRDTAGPGLDGWRRMLAVATERATTPKGRRDLCLIRLMHDLGLRRKEVLGLDLADVDLDSDPPGVRIIGKGKAEKSRVTLNTPTVAALRSWIAAHPDPRPAVALFVGLDPGADPAGRLTPTGAWAAVRDLGRRAGLTRAVWPHALRHSGITRALDLAGGDVRKVQRFSRHAKMETLMRYDENRRDDAGAIARMLGDDA